MTATAPDLLAECRRVLSELNDDAEGLDELNGHGYPNWAMRVRSLIQPLLARLRPAAESPGAEWRVGTHYNIHVYEGERPVATFLKPEDAARAVAAVNDAAPTPPASEAEAPPPRTPLAECRREAEKRYASKSFGERRMSDFYDGASFALSRLPSPGESVGVDEEQPSPAVDKAMKAYHGRRGELEGEKHTAVVRARCLELVDQINEDVGGAAMAGLQSALANLVRWNPSVLSAGAGQAPDGWKLVPVEATREMADAYEATGRGNFFDESYDAMLSAAPLPAGEGQPIEPNYAREMFKRHASPPGADEVDRILEAAEKLAHRTGSTFTPDPEKIAAYRRAHTPPTAEAGGKVCPTCKGSGYEPWLGRDNSEEVGDCPDCAGTGRLPEPAWKEHVAAAYAKDFPDATPLNFAEPAPLPAGEEAGERLTKPFKPCGIYYPDSDIFEIVTEDGFAVHHHIPGSNVSIMRDAQGAIVGMQVEQAGAIFSASPPVTGLEPPGCPTPGACSCSCPPVTDAGEVERIARIALEAYQEADIWEKLPENRKKHWLRVARTVLATARAGEADVERRTIERCALRARSFLVGDPYNGIPLRNPTANEIADELLRLLPAPGKGGE